MKDSKQDEGDCCMLSPPPPKPEGPHTGWENTKPAIVQLSALMEGFGDKNHQPEWIIQKPLSLGHETHPQPTFKYTTSAILGLNFEPNNESTQDRPDSSWEVPWFFGLFPARLLSPTRSMLRTASRLPGLMQRGNRNRLTPLKSSQSMKDAWLSKASSA